MDRTDDRQLVRRVLRGDSEAFATLTAKYAESVHALSYARMLNHADAEDVTQETFLRAYEKLGQLRDPDRFESWAHRIATALTADRFRQRARETPMDTHGLLSNRAADDDAYDAFERGEDAARLLEPALRTLPEHLRTAFVMLHVTGMSYASLPRRLHISPTSAERRVQRARDRLRQYFRRVGAADAARSLIVMAPLSDAFLARLDGAWRAGSPPAAGGIQGGAARPAGLLAAGVVTTAVLFAGAFGAHVRLLHWGDLRVEGALRYVEPIVSSAPALTPPSAGADLGTTLELIAPGEQWRGWTPSEPAGDATLPVPVRGLGPLGRDVSVVRNDFGVYKAIPPTHGELTVDVWLKASGADTNASLGFTAGRDGSGQPYRIAMLHRLDGETWNYVVHDADAVSFRVGDRAWHRVAITYDTRAATYDLDFDGERIAKGVPCNPAFAGRAVNGVRMHSGRGGRGAPLHFAQLRVSAGNAEPGRDAPAPVVGEPGPPTIQDRVFLRSGRIGAVSLAPYAPAYHAYPGERLRGSLSVVVTNDHGPAADVYTIETPTWGDRRAFRAVAGPLSQGRNELRVDIDRVAPTAPGTYYIIVASSGETGPEFVASGTNWSNDYPRWGDDTDIAAWPEALAREAVTTGFVSAPWTVGGGRRSDIEVGATAVRVVVAVMDASRQQPMEVAASRP